MGEMEAIAQANEHLGTWRLDDCELYVTLEPCPMCAGAILNARIRRVWYGARDEAFGACGGVTNLFMESFPNRPRPWWAAFWERTAAGCWRIFCRAPGRRKKIDPQI